MYKLGFIGFGNMAYAIAKGILKEDLLSADGIYVYEISQQAKSKAISCKFNIVETIEELVNSSDIVCLCVKPQNFTDVLSAIKPFGSNKTFLSIAAGIKISKIINALGDVAVIRAMPNTPLLIASGATALTANEKTDESIFSFVKKIFGSVGSVYELPENKFNEVINVNGSTPAYIYYFAKIITDFADECGIDKSTAMNMFCDTLIGSAQMLLKSGKSDEELIDMVSSKGGTTVAALEKFKETGFEASLLSGLKAALTRAEELGSMK